MLRRPRHRFLSRKCSAFSKYQAYNPWCSSRPRAATALYARIYQQVSEWKRYGFRTYQLKTLKTRHLNSFGLGFDRSQLGEAIDTADFRMSQPCSRCTWPYSMLSSRASELSRRGRFYLRIAWFPHAEQRRRSQPGAVERSGGDIEGKAAALNDCS